MLMSFTYPGIALADTPNRQSKTTYAVTGTSATGMDLALQLLIKMRKEQTEATSQYTLQSTVLPRSELPLQNQRALTLLRTWMEEPDDLGNTWWDKFEHDLAQNRLKFREIE